MVVGAPSVTAYGVRGLVRSPPLLVGPQLSQCCLYVTIANRLMQGSYMGELSCRATADWHRMAIKNRCEEAMEEEEVPRFIFLRSEGRGDGFIQATSYENASLHSR